MKGAGEEFTLITGGPMRVGRRGVCETDAFRMPPAGVAKHRTCMSGYALPNHHTGFTLLDFEILAAKKNTLLVVQTHPPLGINICTRSQEDVDGLGMALT